ncbi:MAG: anaerobic ribonucleoside-triphosphate reductase activating protein [Rhodospirillales bacterium]|nr:anaerobic ribonucleoside-triphosphate reductase activating protein [Rhodospirillales bacterium]USO08437.1 MAG: anaerobic ribonucleoside-triphosphate reductase activating protein [Rhodospirillales bacterium]
MSTVLRHKPQGITLPVYNVTPFTMLDYPGKTACIIWFSGCNMRCPYCHNPQIVKGKGRGDIAQVMDFLRRRQGLLDGVVLSGGECTLYPDMPALVRDIKALGYAVKIDTNGTRPDVLLPLLDAKLIDYIALDYKAPRAKFHATTGMNQFEVFSKTLSYLCHDGVPFEVRTTIHSDFLNESDINAIMDDLAARKYHGTYYIQNFTGTGSPTLAPLTAHKPLDWSVIHPRNTFKLEFRNF